MDAQYCASISTDCSVRSMSSRRLVRPVIRVSLMIAFSLGECPSNRAKSFFLSTA